MSKLRDYLVRIKDTNPWLYFIWTEHQQRLKGIKELKNNTDLEAINKLYFNCSGKYPDLNDPQTFSEKQQWLKVNYYDPLMEVCADKIAVRKYIKEKGQVVYQKGKETREAIVEKYGDDIDNMKKEGSKFWRFVKNRLFKKKK